MQKNAVARLFEDCLVKFHVYASIPDTLSMGSRFFVIGMFIIMIFGIPALIICYPIAVEPLTFMPCTPSLLGNILNDILLGGGILAIIGFFMRILGK